MPTKPEIALIISTYQRPFYLKRALLSIAMQRDVQGKMEVVVTDDGSEDETPDVIEEYAKEVDFPVRMTTHRHDGFRLARCRNEGVAASTAPYLLFTDADCLLPPHHIKLHLQHQRRGFVVGGECYRLDQEVSQRIAEPEIISGQFVQWISREEKARIQGKAYRANIYSFFRCRMLPRLTGCNIAAWRSDIERVNGFDENFIGWGWEDRDLQLRLSRLGLRVKSILSHTAVYHLWHQPHSTFARNGEGTANLRYYKRKFVPSYCENGLEQDRPDTLAIHFSNDMILFPQSAGLRRAA
jgi:glycosyltransferase involved in cell wall biosynthesis